MSLIKNAVKILSEGGMVIVVDDKDRENEGDFLCLAEYITPDKINFMAKVGRGLICVPMEGSRLDKLGLYPMVANNSSQYTTGFTVSVDAKEGVTTGISSSDRANTVLKLIDSRATGLDFPLPGHIFPLRAREGGVLRRAGHTEAAVDLAKLAGAFPAGVICEVMRDDGEMARLDDLQKIAKQHDMLIISVQDIIEHQMKHERFVKRIESTILPTDFGEFDLYVYEDLLTNEEHVALVKGKLEDLEVPLVRVHSMCLTGDVFHSRRCDCGNQLTKAMKLINDKGGVILYMAQEGRGIGLSNKIKAYKLQDQGLDTVEANEHLGFPADLRDYGVGAQILRDLGIEKLKLLTNNPAKIVGLEGYGLKILERVAIKTEVMPENKHYLETKKKKLRHLL